MSPPSPIVDAAMPVLDWTAMPLPGRTLIEASAGTGKTWNIGLIYLRLLLETSLRADRIIVATFSEAAAQELRERLRRRLREAERVLAAEPVSDAADDPLAAWLDDRYADPAARREALHAILRARADLDRAPVGTIHALCQRLQRDFPLESGASFGELARIDEGDLRRECVEDFWRQRYLAGTVDPIEADVVLPAGPESLLRDLASLTSGDVQPLPADGDEVIDEIVRRLARPENRETFSAWADNKSLYAPRRRALPQRFETLAALLAHVSPDIDAIGKTIDKYFAPDELREQCAIDSPVPNDPLVADLQALRALLAVRGGFVHGRVLADAAAFCRREMPRRARARHAQTFAMMIDAVWERLHGDGGHAFADRLFDAFPAALIDEFQDTDARQYAIFDRIYRHADGAPRGSLIAIGDPKQAIYGFRGGDVTAYLAARERTARQYSLGTNHRSASALVHAWNGLYARADGGFHHPRIRYCEVEPGGRAERGQPYRIDGKPLAQPLAIHRFRAEESAGDSALGRLEAAALDDCAERIVELLTDPRHTLGDAPIAPGDIAVLLPNNAQIAALRQRLVARGVPCAGQGRGHVFESATAAELELVLTGVVHAGDEQAVRGALSTRLLGATLAQFDAWRRDAEAFERELERFAQWRELARAGGVPALVEAIVDWRGAALLALPDGERRLTDLRHLAELVAAEPVSRNGLESTLAWLAATRRDNSGGAGDERQLRIESDSRRVQLLTIHASKGLEFPIVFLPLAWRIADRTGMRAPAVLRFHDKDGTQRVDVGSRAFVDHRRAHHREDLQERLRLLYVAMTRAVHALHIYWADRGERDADDAVAWKRAAIDVLLLAAQEEAGLEPGEASLEALAGRIPGMRVAGPAVHTGMHYTPPMMAHGTPAAQAPLPASRPAQWQHSFSSLVRSIETPPVLPASGARDEAESNVDALLATADAAIAMVPDDPHLLALAAWRGPRFGDAIHQLLERAAAGPLWPAQRPLVQQQLAAQGLLAAGVDGEEQARQVAALIERVRGSDLGDGLRLDDLSRDDRVAEFEFQCPLRHADVAALRALCAAHGLAEVLPPGLSLRMLDGMLVGFADLVFRWQGRYHVLDYKTNWLGARLDDYRDASLDEAMHAHHYPLQALLYTLALHRYLRQRLPGYMPAEHLGDSWYLFVRATGLASGLGTWRRRWPHALIESMDAALDGDAENAA